MMHRVYFSRPTNLMLSSRMISACSLGSFGSNIPVAPFDSILDLQKDFEKDSSPKKINLSIGVYRSEDGKVNPLNCVKKAPIRGSMAYLPITGNPIFVKKAQELCFGENFPLLKEDRIASCQTLSGTGALRLAADFLSNFWPHKEAEKVIYVPSPTYPNHYGILSASGFTTKLYPYYDPATKSLAIPSALEFFNSLPEESIVLFHACAHNPTGLDPSVDEWASIASIVKKKKHFILFDMAYQGFATGDLDADAYPVRLFAQEVPYMCVAQSFAKNFGLYGQRAGALHFSAVKTSEKVAISSQLSKSIRSMYSNPPVYGAEVVEAILTSPELISIWKGELKEIVTRIDTMRSQLREQLEKNGSKHDWSLLTKGKGMMTFTGLSQEQVLRLRREYHIYMTLNGRLSIPGLFPKNIEYVAKAIHEVSK